MSERLLFGEFFYALRNADLKVGLTEWIALQEALASGVIEPNLTAFYHVARAMLIKSETLFDKFDEVFSSVFQNGKLLPTKVHDELLEWLENPLQRPNLSPEELAELQQLPLKTLQELFEQRLREQDERHDGGNRWIGTGGTSPFGHGGINPAGVRTGGAGGGKSAVKIAMERRFRDYRADRVLDTRSIAVALKKLRRLSRQDGILELDVDESIDRTSRNAGELELAFQPPRRNEARVLLLMDVGGSMEPHTRLVETLFSAASQLNHWKRFEAYTFHNCVYDKVYSSIWGREGISCKELLENRPRNTSVIFVGDASMAPSELTERHGAIDYYERQETPGIVWLHRFRSQFPHSLWLNPTRPEWWKGWTCQVIARLFPMFPLTIAGLEDAIDLLLKRTEAPIPELDPSLLRFNLGFA